MEVHSYVLIERVMNAIFIAIALFVIYYTLSYMHDAMGFLQNLQINTRILLAQLPFGILITAICQSTVKILYSMGYDTKVDLPNTHYFLWYFADFGASLRIGTSTCLLVERVIASINVDRYEHYCTRIPYIAIISILVEVILATVVCMLLQCSSLFTRLVGAFIAIVLVIISLIIFLILPRWSLSIYNRFLMVNQTRQGPHTNTKFPSLSQRFQSSENLRVSKFLRELISLEWGLGATVVIIQLATEMHPHNDHVRYIILTVAYAWTMIWTIISISFIRRRIKVLKEVLQPDKQESNKVTRDPEAVNNIYFGMYENDWR